MEKLKLFNEYTLNEGKNLRSKLTAKEKESEDSAYFKSKHFKDFKGKDEDNLNCLYDEIEKLFEKSIIDKDHVVIRKRTNIGLMNIKEKNFFIGIALGLKGSFGEKGDRKIEILNFYEDRYHTLLEYVFETFSRHFNVKRKIDGRWFFLNELTPQKIKDMDINYEDYLIFKDTERFGL